MSPMYSALLVVLCALSYTHAHSSMCLPPMGKTPFDEQKFVGTWYNIAGIMSEQVPHMPSDCALINYSVLETGNITHINMDGKVQAGGKTMEFAITGQPFMHHTKAVIHTAFKSTAANADSKWKGAGVMTTSILGTDYTDFAIVYSCKPIYVDSVDMFAKFEILKVWGRKPTMEPKLLEVLKNVLSGYGFDTDKMVLQDNSKC